MSEIPALIFTNGERNRRLFDHLLSIGLIVIPIFIDNEDGSSEIDYMIVKCNSTSRSYSKKPFKTKKESSRSKARDTLLTCASTPVNSSGCSGKILNFPTKF